MRAFRFQIPFKTPIRMKGESYSSRHGVLLEKDGKWAEASPLPGFSKETIDDVILALRGEQTVPASLDFALSVLNEPFKYPIKVPFNNLLLGDSAAIVEAAQLCRQSSCKAAKLKVGQNSVEDDIALVQSVRQILPPTIQLRLDANQAWEFEQALQFLEATSEMELEYIEEPLKDSNRLEELFAKTQVKYALDETLVRSESLRRWPNAAALICKPSLLGGRKKIEQLADTSKPIVFSAAFESGVGVARIAQLATQYSPTIPAGLDTLDWLQDSLLIGTVIKQDGLMTIPNPLQVAETELEEIEI